MYACRCGASLSSTRFAAASTAGGGSISGLPSVKSNTLSAPRSCLRRAPSSNVRRADQARGKPDQYLVLDQRVAELHQHLPARSALAEVLRAVRGRVEMQSR